MTIKNYIFDLDGTIIDSKNEITECIIKACEKSKVKIDKNKIPNLIGKPIKNILQESLIETSEEKLDITIKEYRKIYDLKNNYSCILYSGIINFLDELRLNQKNIILLTNKPIIPTEKILYNLNIKSYFNDIYTIDKIKNKTTKFEILKHILKEKNYKTENTLLIGDTISDMKAAKENNVLAVAALWGYEKNKNLLIANADLYLEHPICDNFFEQIDKFNEIRNKLCKQLFNL